MSLVNKLHIKPNQKLAILNPPEGYLEKLSTLPEGVVLTDIFADLDVVHLFVQNRQELETLAPKAIGALKHDGLLWISYPKQSAKVATDLTRDRGWDVVTEAGLRGVAQVSIDETWSAVRFRPLDRVGRKERTS